MGDDLIINYIFIIHRMMISRGQLQSGVLLRSLGDLPRRADDIQPRRCCCQRMYSPDLLIRRPRSKRSYPHHP